MSGILEFKHIGPFDGCFHRWEYLFVEEDGTVHPIIFTPGRLTPWQVVLLAWSQESFEKGLMKPKSFEFKTYAGLFRDFVWHKWGQELFDEIPHNYIPAFWKFAQEMGLAFVWTCDECGETQDGEPIYMAGYHGNGGAGIEAEGWLCENCAMEQAERYNCLVEEG